jgi:hypothetical protein
MALSADDLTLAIALVGEISAPEAPDGALRAQAPAINATYDWDSLYPGFGLDLLYVQRDLTKVARGVAWKQIQSNQGPTQLGFQDRAKALAVSLQHLEEEIELRLAQARASVAGVSTGVMTTTAPTSPPYPAPYPDGNADLYRGTPYGSPTNPQGSQGTGW